MTERSKSDCILGTARELYGRAVYSHKTHEIERQNWSKKSCNTYRANIGLVSLTTLLAVVSVGYPSRLWTITTAVLAALTTGFVVWQSSFDPVGKETQHRIAAKELLWLREQLLLLIGRCHSDSEPVSHLQSSLETITRELTAVYKFAPNTSPAAYADATAALKGGQFTFSEEEIDAFLPTALRKTASA
ncbi:MAG TPA: SLATT domain-containing protein [Candidatus Acidoferrales bacterium]|nr:SLATT domain-containing protein [Candidatus Acidoferrales bacterium]